MTDDATLSDFGSPAADDDSSHSRSDERDSSATAGAESAQTDTANGETGATGTETALSTYAWGEYTCRQCERATDRAWRADGVLVCPDCKEW